VLHQSPPYPVALLIVDPRCADALYLPREGGKFTATR
jgi:hypothetical protein